LWCYTCPSGSSWQGSSLGCVQSSVSLTETSAGRVLGTQTCPNGAAFELDVNSPGYCSPIPPVVCPNNTTQIGNKCYNCPTGASSPYIRGGMGDIACKSCPSGYSLNPDQSYCTFGFDNNYIGTVSCPSGYKVVTIPNYPFKNCAKCSTAGYVLSTDGSRCEPSTYENCLVANGCPQPPLVPGSSQTVWPYSDGHCDARFPTKTSDNRCYNCTLMTVPNPSKTGCETDPNPCGIQ
jgi:hypothetical protein